MSKPNAAELRWTPEDVQTLRPFGSPLGPHGIGVTRSAGNAPWAAVRRMHRARSHGPRVHSHRG